MKKSESWDLQYLSNDCLFGTAHNSMLEKFAHNIPQPADVLNIGDGEGFNSIYLAKKNHRVVSLDWSIEAQKKAQENAYQAGVFLEFITTDFLEWECFTAQFDLITLFFVHTDAPSKQQFADKIIKLLKPGGIFLFEGFHINQLGQSTLGPNEPQFLYSEKEIESLYTILQPLHLDVKNATSFKGSSGNQATCNLQYAGLQNSCIA